MQREWTGSQSVKVQLIIPISFTYLLTTIHVKILLVMIKQKNNSNNSLLRQRSERQIKINENETRRVKIVDD